MSFECKLFISLLKLTKETPALIKDVKNDSRLPLDIVEKLLQKLQNQNLLYLTGDSVHVETQGRLQLAVLSATSGYNIEDISNLLCWQEFEEIAATALRNNNFSVSKNVRFKGNGRRWEIDVVGCKKPLVICIDCKHYHHAIAPSALKKIVNSQIDRTKALADTLPNPKLNLDCTQWDSAKFVPAVLSLLPSSFKFVFDVPIVPVLQLQDFLLQLPAYANTLRFIPKSFGHLSDES
ncbi:MAG: DUF234 domain-containing protein [Candidatus Bathyarchaeota archaeon]|nr:DUF234 domain-containing protein [Candidatus Bathyarchaeota archaeon]